MSKQIEVKTDWRSPETAPKDRPNTGVLAFRGLLLPCIAIPMMNG